MQSLADTVVSFPRCRPPPGHADSADDPAHGCPVEAGRPGPEVGAHPKGHQSYRYHSSWERDALSAGRQRKARRGQGRLSRRPPCSLCTSWPPAHLESRNLFPSNYHIARASRVLPQQPECCIPCGCFECLSRTAFGHDSLLPFTQDDPLRLPPHWRPHRPH